MGLFGNKCGMRGSYTDMGRKAGEKPTRKKTPKCTKPKKHKGSHSWQR